MTKISVKVPDILLPNDSIDMSKWAVVACTNILQSLITGTV